MSACVYVGWGCGSVCVCVHLLKGLITLHRPVIVRERVIVAIKVGHAHEAVWVLGKPASNSLIKWITYCGHASVQAEYNSLIKKTEI